MPPSRDLFAGFERMRREIDELFGDVFERSTGLRGGGFSPSVDVYYTDDPPRAVVKAELAGICIEDVALEIRGRQLLIGGERRPADADGRLYQQIEIDHGPFRRIVELGADVVAEPAEMNRAVRRATRSLSVGEQLTGGADLVVDCVGTEASLAAALAVVRPRGTIALVGMPGRVRIDLTPLWQREVRLAGSYAYRHDTFPGAFELVDSAGLGRLVSALYPLERYRDAIEHAAHVGSRGGVKIAFDLRQPTRRPVAPSSTSNGSSR